jgi:hypothetical protein
MTPMTNHDPWRVWLYGWLDAEYPDGHVPDVDMSAAYERAIQAMPSDLLAVMERDGARLTATQLVDAVADGGDVQTALERIGS